MLIAEPCRDLLLWVADSIGCRIPSWYRARGRADAVGDRDRDCAAPSLLFALRLASPNWLDLVGCTSTIDLATAHHKSHPIRADVLTATAASATRWARLRSMPGRLGLADFHCLCDSTVSNSQRSLAAGWQPTLSSQAAIMSCSTSRKFDLGATLSHGGGLRQTRLKDLRLRYNMMGLQARGESFVQESRRSTVHSASSAQQPMLVDLQLLLARGRCHRSQSR